MSKLSLASRALAVSAWALAAAAALAQSGPQTGQWQPADQLRALREAQARIAAGQDPIPGPRSCFWSRGPASADPYINIAYPDAATYYWAATFTTPPGAKLRLEGRFAHARYQSLISYDAAGVPVESVADYLLKPQPGSTNPFLPGADRRAEKRDYRLEVVDAPPPPNQPVGMNLVGTTRDTLHTPKYGAGQQMILYRIYVADKGTDETGNGGLPVPVLTLADGKEVRGDAACPLMKTRQPLQIDPAAMAVPMDKYQELLEAARKHGPAYPATNPATFYQQLDREALYDIYRGVPPKADARKSEGGFYPNLDNQYIRTILNRRLGKVVVLRAKAPTTPPTWNGDATVKDAQLRYWSWCSNQGFANTRVNACVYDQQIPVDAQGYYTIVISRAADRPRNAQLECGIAWLPMADDGDGAGDPDVTVLQLRNMLGTGEFKNAVQGVRGHATMAEDMGEYYPRTRYMSTSAVETALPCIIPAKR